MGIENFHIEGFSQIKNQQVSLNGETLFKSGETEFNAFIKSAYQALDTQYPKFFKMDQLSKLALIASDLLLNKQTEKNVALVLCNKASCLDTDRKHQASLQGEHPYASPAVFVYTLPNICLGEISIKHGLLSENSFFIFDEFNAEYLQIYAEHLLSTKKAEKVLCGWVDFDNGKYDAFLYVVAKNGIFAHSKMEINRLYKTE